jgi:hypothetical protein
MAELREKPALSRELENLRVLVPAPCQEDVVFLIDEDAVLGFRPLEALPGAAPR